LAQVYFLLACSNGEQGLGRLFEELKRRNVFRVAIAYLIATWLVLQVADIVLEIIAAPGWVAQVFLLVFALGFPFALVFSWAYELTPEGVKREEDVDREQSITSTTGRKLNLITIGMLVAVLAIVGLERAFFSQSANEAPEQSTQMDQNSIAVLAFEDMSPDGDQAYFAEGLSEELLNVLAQVDELKVAGRTSSFAFRGQSKDLREIGEILNVAHILEGSVRKSGNRIRVTAQLVKASDGFHLFSDTYESELSDVFAVQDEIAQSISSALLSEITGTDSVDRATPTDPEAYDLYLLARQKIHSRDPLSMREALSMLGRALEIDHEYAPAIVQKALATYLLSDTMGSYGDIPQKVALPEARRLVDQALAIDPELAEAHAVNGLLLDTGELNNDDAISALERALELNPNMSDAANWLSTAYDGIDQADESRAILEELVGRDPMYGPAFSNLTNDYARTGDFDLADALISRVERIVGENDEILQSRGMMSVMRGEPAGAVRDIKRALAENPRSTITQMWYGFALLGVADYETMAAAGIPEHQIEALWAIGNEEDAMAVLQDLNIRTAFPQRTLGTIGRMFNSAGASQEFIDYIGEQFGSTESLLEEFPARYAWGTAYLGELAYAYRQVGDEEMVERLLDEMRDTLDDQGKVGVNNWVRHWGWAQLAALSGDVDGALTSMQAALDSGYSYQGGFDSGVYESLRGEPGFEQIKQALAQHVDDERAKLDMPPYRPFPETDKRRNRPSY